MKHLKYLLILIILIFESCRVNPFLAFKKDTWIIINMKNNQIIKSKNTCAKFIFTGTEILIPSVVNGELDTLLFDTGYSGSLLRFDTLYNTTDILRFSTPSGKKKLKAGFDTSSISNEIASIDKAFCTMIPEVNSLSLCNKKEMRNILGNKMIKDRVMKLSFSDTTLCLYDSIDYNLEGYCQIKSLFDNQGIYIYLNYNGIELKYLFDTGADGTLFNSKKNYRLFKNENDIVFDGISMQDVGGYISSTSYIKTDQNISIGSTQVNLDYVFFNTSIKSGMAGIGFISNFDWIIDWKNKKVFAKALSKNQKSKGEIINEKFSNITYKVYPKEGELQITFRVLNNNPVYPLYSVIKSVNGVEISSDNICYYTDFLNQTDWNTLELVIKKNKFLKKDKKLAPTNFNLIQMSQLD